MDESELMGLAARRDLKIKLAWAVAAKMLALLLLWLLFFRSGS
jgi:hypothetical protein